MNLVAKLQIKQLINHKKSLQTKLNYLFSDSIYSFNQSFCKFAVRTTNLDAFQEEDFERLGKLGVNRYIVDITNQQEMEEFLKNKMDDKIQYMMDKQIFAGSVFYLPFLAPKDSFLREEKVQGFLQSLAHFQKIRSQSKMEENRKFRIITGILADQKIENTEFFEEIIQNVYDNYFNLYSIVHNTFDIRLVFFSRNKNPWGNLWQRDLFFDLFKDHQLGMNLNLIKGLDMTKDQEVPLKELYMYIYEHSEKMKAVILNDYKYDQEKNKYKQCPLGEGVMSFTHLTDIFKLQQFEGFVVFNQKEFGRLEKDIGFMQNLLEEQGFNKVDMELYQQEQQKLNDNVGAFLDI